MKININFLEKEPFINFKNQKKSFFKKLLLINNFHFKKCKTLNQIKNKLYFYKKKINEIKYIPYLPISLFKDYDLLSINKKNIFKILNSSGTSSSNLSKIFLDKNNSLNQQKALKKIIESFIGKKRLPMLIIDRKPNKSLREKLSAKQAAIYGFSIFGTDYTYALNDNYEINYNVINNFLNKHIDKKIFLFGFTYDIFEILINKLDTKKLKLNFSNAILLHGGGWKKLEEKKISQSKFNNKLLNKFNLKDVRNYYGMIEQTGSIYLECKCGYLTSSHLSEVLIRDEKLNLCKEGKKGLVQTLSIIPTSYPGHSILTEDIGELVSQKKCKCSMKGTKFLIHGRTEKSEIRGCSDV